MEDYMRAGSSLTPIDLKPHLISDHFYLSIKMKLNIALLLYVFVNFSCAFPSSYKKVATWGLEGYAKDNPLGTTTGGKGGRTVVVTTAAELVSAVAGTERKIVKVKGRIVLPTRLSVGSNTSVIGIGSSAHITGAGLNIYNGDNVIVQNLKISHILDNDCITIRNSTRVWIDHNEFASDISQGPDYYVSLLLLHVNSSFNMLTTPSRMGKSTSFVHPTGLQSHGTISTTTGNRP
jgi:hypothetical protein